MGKRGLVGLICRHKYLFFTFLNPRHNFHERHPWHAIGGQLGRESLHLTLQHAIGLGGGHGVVHAAVLILLFRREAVHDPQQFADCSLLGRMTRNHAGIV